MCVRLNAVATQQNGRLFTIDFDILIFVMKLSVANFLILKFLCLIFIACVKSNEAEATKEWFKIEGKVQAPDAWAKLNPEWKLHTNILIDGGEYRAFLR